MKSILMIKSTLKTLCDVRDQLPIIASTQHTLAVARYPDSGFELSDSLSLSARNCFIQLQHQIQIKMIESGVIANQHELDRLLHRVADLEDFFLKSSGGDADDLARLIEELNSDCLKYKKSIHSLMYQTMEFDLTETIVDELASLGINSIN